MPRHARILTRATIRNTIAQDYDTPHSEAMLALLSVRHRRPSAVRASRPSSNHFSSVVVAAAAGAVVRVRNVWFD